MENDARRTSLSAMHEWSPEKWDKDVIGNHAHMYFDWVLVAFRFHVMQSHMNANWLDNAQPELSKLEYGRQWLNHDIRFSFEFKLTRVY